MKESGTHTSDATKTHAGKIILFKTAGILSPFVFLLLVELFLRAVGYGDDLDLFIEYPQDQRFMVFNPKASQRYFIDPDLATTGNAELFKKEKDPNTLRIFVLGESTTVGYPYFHNASFHRLLQYRLMTTFPGKRLEIVNLALTGTNSHTVRGFAKDLPPYQPDAVLIYCGHNEYYGTLGVASTEQLGSSPWIGLALKLRELRLVQWMTQVYASIRGGSKHDAGSRMKRMVGEENIPFNSELYRNGIEQFEMNMSETVRLLHEAGIPVFISNLVSNEADIKPFTSQVDTARYATFMAKYALASEALAKDDSLTAYTLLGEAQQDYNQHALCNYKLGRLALWRGDSVAAKEYFGAARDLDGLRFRAPSALNEVIGKLCKMYPNARLVDAQSAFERRSPGRIIGDGLMLEHVHPNVLGYAVLSDAFYQAMKTARVFSVVYEKEMSFDELVQTMPVSAVDSLSGMYRVAALKEGWPFHKGMQRAAVTAETRLEKLAWQLSQSSINWQVAMDSAYGYYVDHGALDKAEKVVEGMVLEHPTEQNYWERVAVINARMGNPDKAIVYFEKAFDLAPTFERARYLLVLHLQMDRPFEALPYINYGIKNGRASVNLQVLKEGVEDVIKTQEQLRTDSTNLAMISHIARAYLSMDNLEGADKYARKALAIDAANAEARAISQEIHHKQ